jgi:hypothetical protein
MPAPLPPTSAGEAHVIVSDGFAAARQHTPTFGYFGHRAISFVTTRSHVLDTRIGPADPSRYEPMVLTSPALDSATLGGPGGKGRSALSWVVAGAEAGTEQGGETMARTTATNREGALQDLIGELEDTAKQAGDRITECLVEARVRQRLADAADAIKDVRLAVLRRLQGEPAAKPLEDMTVRELHELAGERQLPGRPSMSKAELLDALRKG